VETGCFNDPCMTNSPARGGITDPDGMAFPTGVSTSAVEPVSEPAVIALFALGLVGIGFVCRRQS
jgi:hypothetical protein